MNTKNWRFRTGVILIALSTLLFVSLLLIPFLEMENSVKISITTIVLVAGEITFWTGGILVGKEIFTKYKAYFNPMTWFKKKIEKTE